MDLLDVPDRHQGAVTIARWGGWLVQVLPMAFNDRLVLAGDDPMYVGYEHGWCYPKGPACVIAALAWDPDADAEPAGFIKRVTVSPRRAGDRYVTLAVRLAAGRTATT